MARTKWYLFYLRFTYERQRQEIDVKEFNSELDMLLWAGESQIPKGHNLNHIVGPDGLSKMPSELYERIDILRRQQSEEEKEAEKEEVVVPPVKRGRGRPRKETQCIAP